MHTSVARDQPNNVKGLSVIEYIATKSIHSKLTDIPQFLSNLGAASYFCYLE